MTSAGNSSDVAFLQIEAKPGLHPQDGINVHIRHLLRELDRVVHFGEGGLVKNKQDEVHMLVANKAKRYGELKIEVVLEGTRGNKGSPASVISSQMFSHRPETQDAVDSLFNSRGLLIDPKHRNNASWKEIINKAKKVIDGVDRYRQLAYSMVSEVEAGWDDYPVIDAVHHRFMVELETLGVDVCAPRTIGQLGPFMMSLVWPIMNGVVMKDAEMAMAKDIVLRQYTAIAARWAELQQLPSKRQEAKPSKRELKRMQREAAAAVVLEPEVLVVAPETSGVEPRSVELADAAIAAGAALVLEVGPALNLGTPDDGASPEDELQAVSGERVEPAMPVDTPAAQLVAGAGSGA